MSKYSGFEYNVDVLCSWYKLMVTTALLCPRTQSDYELYISTFVPNLATRWVTPSKTSHRQLASDLPDFN
jgi:hypothetical protein